MINLFIECHNPIGEPHTRNTMVDDYIIDSAWLTRAEMMCDEIPLSDTLQNEVFWQTLHTPPDTVLHLGRKVSF
jgi:hypothetical protein